MFIEEMKKRLKNHQFFNIIIKKKNDSFSFPFFF